MCDHIKVMEGKDCILDQEHATLYAQYRPKYSSTNIVPLIMNYMGCGTEQVRVKSLCCNQYFDQTVWSKRDGWDLKCQE